jgi:hypothetical protein
MRNVVTPAAIKNRDSFGCCSIQIDPVPTMIDNCGRFFERVLHPLLFEDLQDVGLQGIISILQVFTIRLIGPQRIVERSPEIFNSIWIAVTSIVIPKIENDFYP